MKKADLLARAVDPFCQTNWNKPLWCIHGYESHPSMHCLQIMNGAVWGYSVYKRQPGFRTLGIDLAKFHENKALAVYFNNMEYALDYLRAIVTPKC